MSHGLFSNWVLNRVEVLEESKSIIWSMNAEGAIDWDIRLCMYIGVI